VGGGRSLETCGRLDASPYITTGRGEALVRNDPRTPDQATGTDYNVPSFSFSFNRTDLGKPKLSFG